MKWLAKGFSKTSKTLNFLNLLITNSKHHLDAIDLTYFTFLNVSSETTLMFVRRTDDRDSKVDFFLRFPFYFYLPILTCLRLTWSYFCDTIPFYLIFSLIFICFCVATTICMNKKFKKKRSKTRSNGEPRWGEAGKEEIISFFFLTLHRQISSLLSTSWRFYLVFLIPRLASSLTRQSNETQAKPSDDKVRPDKTGPDRT